MVTYTGAQTHHNHPNAASNNENIYEMRASNSQDALAMRKKIKELEEVKENLDFTPRHQRYKVGPGKPNPFRFEESPLKYH